MGHLRKATTMDSIKKHKETIDARWAKFLVTILDTSLGTLWWLREDLIEESHKRLGKAYSAGARRGHPAISLSPHSLYALHHACPMLQGFSRDKGHGYKLTGITTETERATYFSALFPVLVSGKDFLKAAEDADREQLVGKFFDRCRVHPNINLLKLTAEQMRGFRVWLERKGLV